jgi:hypothetical protein
MGNSTAAEEKLRWAQKTDWARRIDAVVTFLPREAKDVETHQNAESLAASGWR